MVLFLASASGIATGDAEAVGVHYVPATEKHPPLRIYYPASQQLDHKQVGFFQDTSTAYFLQGYWSVLMCRHRDTILYKIGLVVLQYVARLLPMHYLKVPGVYQDVPPLLPQKLPLILFSHGLTGTGQENSVLLSAWAKQGYFVVGVHHTDGSANRVSLPDGRDLWYDPGPPFSDYDATFRPRQIEGRVQELLQARDWCLSSDCPLPLADDTRTIVAGFSYGAATAALLAAQQVLPSLRGVILLDGWFYIDVSLSAGVEFEFPRQALEASHLSELPALFVNSEAFTGVPKLWKTTLRMVGQFHADAPHVLAQTSHNNFCDVVFWLPPWWLRTVGMIGPAADPRRPYEEMVRRTVEFLKCQCQKEE